MRKVTVIILSHNGLEDTSECLRSLMRISYRNFDVMVVDNGSDRDEVAVLERQFKPKYKCIDFGRFENNLGFAGGNNEAIKRCTSEYVLLLNNDTVVERDFLGQLMKCMLRDQKIAAVQAKIRSYYKRDYFDPSGCGGYLDRLGFPYTRGRIGLHVECDEGQYDEEVEIFWAAGAAALVRRKYFLEAGGFEEKFFAYHEETDLCWRLKDMGYRIMSCPSAVVYHKGEGFWRRHRSRKIYLIHRNHLLMIARNLPFLQMVWVMPLRLFLDGLTFVHYVYSNSIDYARELVKANVDFWLNVGWVINWRRINNSGRSYGAISQLKPLSIYWLYYVNGTRRYGEVVGGKRKTKLANYSEVLGEK